MDDAELAMRAAKGDREAFRSLLERHYDRVFRLSYRLLGDRANAEDVTQDICVSLARKLQSFRGQSRFSTWLYRLTVNAARDFARRRASIEALNRAHGELSGMAAADFSDRLKRASWLEEMLASLDESLRETAVLVLGEELNHEQAAEVLGVKEATVSWRMHELRKKLKALAKSYED